LIYATAGQHKGSIEPANPPQVSDGREAWALIASRIK